MRKLLAFVLLFTFLFSYVYAGDVSVKGYTRKDGTYVRPHHRSSPDRTTENNYGQASYQQRQEYKSSPTLPSYNNDYDNDGTPNRIDKDDDNDGIPDTQDRAQYNKSNNYQQPVYKSESRYQTSTNQQSESEDKDSGEYSVERVKEMRWEK